MSSDTKITYGKENTLFYTENSSKVVETWGVAEEFEIILWWEENHDITEEGSALVPLDFSVVRACCLISLVGGVKQFQTHVCLHAWLLTLWQEMEHKV